METMQYRHGELLLQQIESIPEGAIVKKSSVVATGKTGHDHRLIGGQILECNTQDGETATYLEITAPGAGVDHEEHGLVSLKTSEKYLIIRQREYRPYDQAARAVED